MQLITNGLQAMAIHCKEFALLLYSLWPTVGLNHKTIYLKLLLPDRRNNHPLNQLNLLMHVTPQMLICKV